MRKIFSVIIITMIVTTVAINIDEVFSQKEVMSSDETVLSIDPPSIDDTSIEPGDLFVINVTVTNVVNLYNWQIRLYWTDPDLLNCARAWLPTGHIFDGMSPIFAKDIHNDTGYVDCGASVIPTMVGVVTADEGLLCQIEFEVQAKGSCDLEFSEPYDVDTFLLYALPPDYFEEGTIEPVDYENGYFRNGLPPTPPVLCVDPVRVVDPNLTACHDFTVNVTVAEVIDLYQWNFTMYYRNNVLEATNVDEGPFLSNVGATSFHQQIANNHNSTHGRIKASCALLGGSGADGNGTLAILTFHVLDIGNTTLTLTETQLKDSTLQPINHTAEDGYFNNTLIRDIAVTNVTLSKTVVGQGYSMNITVTVENQGDLAESFNVTTYHNDTAIILPDGKNYTTTTLTSGNSTTVTFTWNSTGVPYGNYTITAKATPIPGETDTIDNTHTDGVIQVVIPGDVNADGKVNMKDIGEAVIPYGSFPGHPRWDPNADMNDDGKVTILDIALIAFNYGKTYPEE